MDWMCIKNTQSKKIPEEWLTDPSHLNWDGFVIIINVICFEPLVFVNVYDQYSFTKTPCHCTETPCHCTKTPCHNPVQNVHCPVSKY